MEKLFLTSNEVADLLNISQQQAYKIIRDMNKQLDTVINACDAGREGESIFRLVYNEAKCKKKMKRLWISSMEDSAIKEGFDNLCIENHNAVFRTSIDRNIVHTGSGSRNR